MHLDAALIRDALALPLPLPALGSMIDVRAAKAAAVVVPVVLDPEPTVLLVLRSSHLADHAGEVGFPGGKPDPGDADLCATALRELDEEIAVRPGEVEIVGRLVPTPVITGRYLIHPFVGLVAPGAAPRAASPEIARILELRIAPLLRGDHPISAVRGEFNGAAVFAPHVAVDGAVLYGASAYILYELLLRLAGKLGRPLPEPRLEAAVPWGDRYSR